MQGSYIHVGASRRNAGGSTATGKISIYQCAYVFVSALPFPPELMEIREHRARHFECSPNPLAANIRLLHTNFHHAAMCIGKHCIKQLRALHGKEQKREPVVGQLAKSVLREPNGIRKSDHHGFVSRYDRERTEDGIT